jgi:hypothetical protein
VASPVNNPRAQPVLTARTVAAQVGRVELQATGLPQTRVGRLTLAGHVVPPTEAFPGVGSGCDLVAFCLDSLPESAQHCH